MHRLAETYCLCQFHREVTRKLGAPARFWPLGQCGGGLGVCDNKWWNDCLEKRHAKEPFTSTFEECIPDTAFYKQQGLNWGVGVRDTQRLWKSFCLRYFVHLQKLGGSTWDFACYVKYWLYDETKMCFYDFFEMNYLCIFMFFAFLPWIFPAFPVCLTRHSKLYLTSWSSLTAWSAVKRVRMD